MGGIMMPYMAEIGQMGYVTPDQIPSLNLWYNASASSTIVNKVSTLNFGSAVTNGSNISAWTDLSGTGHNANVNGGTGKQPTYAIPAQGGSLGAVLYNSANGNNLDINPTAWSQNLSGLTVYIIARPTSLPATVFPLVVTDTNLGIWWNGTNWTVGHSAGNYGTISITNDTSKFHIYGLIYDGTKSTNLDKVDFIYDLYEKSVSMTFTGTIGTTTGTPAYWFFGGDNRGSSVNATFTSKYMDGYIGEVMVWTRALNHAEQTSVENYLNTKWKLGLT